MNRNHHRPSGGGKAPSPFKVPKQLPLFCPVQRRPYTAPAWIAVACAAPWSLTTLISSLFFKTASPQKSEDCPSRLLLPWGLSEIPVMAAGAFMIWSLSNSVPGLTGLFMPSPPPLYFFQALPQTPQQQGLSLPDLPTPVHTAHTPGQMLVLWAPSAAMSVTATCVPLSHPSSAFLLLW